MSLDLILELTVSLDLNQPAKSPFHKWQLSILTVITDSGLQNDISYL